MIQRKNEEIQEDPRLSVSPEEFAEMAKKAAERDEFQDKWLKVHAEYENTRRRLEKEKTECVKFANEEIVSRLFPIVDNFDMALAAMETAKDKCAVMDGIRLVQKEFHRIMEENGVSRIVAEGKQFDPNFEEAVLVEETEDKPDGTVVQEIRSGYTLNGRLLRPAQVKVAKNVKSTAGQHKTVLGEDIEQ